jgi:hypothetical protein
MPVSFDEHRYSFGRDDDRSRALKGPHFSPGLGGPLPVGELRLIDAKLVGMAGVLNDLIL